jgi:hypothetical protein
LQDGSGSSSGGVNEITVGYEVVAGATAGADKFKVATGHLNDNLIIDGKGGNDTLEIVTRAEDATTPIVRNVENIVIRVQDVAVSNNTDNNIQDKATIDAGRFSGALRWESNNSRADLKVEDVRILDNQITKDVTIAFVDSDPGHVDYALYFDPDSLRNVTNQSGVLDVTLFDSDSTHTPLESNPFDGFSFTINGNSVRVTFGTVNGATATYQDLADKIQAAINNSTQSVGSLGPLNQLGIKVALVSSSTPVGANGAYTAPAYVQISLDGYQLGTGNWLASGGVGTNTSVHTKQDVDNPTDTTLVTSTVILDHVGRGSTGGDLVIGSLSTGDTSTSRGVQQFDITVERDSKLEVISSTNNTLQVVNLVNGAKGVHYHYDARGRLVAREGDLTALGDTNVKTIFEDYALSALKAVGPYEKENTRGADQTIDGATAAQDNGYAMTDIRELNAGAFTGQLKLNAILTANVNSKYLNLKDAANNLSTADDVTFKYHLGTNDDSLNLAISSANLDKPGTTTRADFVLDLKGNGGNDVISTAIYGGDPTGAWTPAATSDGLALADAEDGAAHWYVNSSQNQNLKIDGGDGNDTINTLGSGNWQITLGKGNDTYYADNSAKDATAGHGGSTGRATWVFNTIDQVTAKADVAERALDNLKSDNNDKWKINDATITESGSLLKLRVAFRDVSASANNTPDRVTLPDGSGVYFSKVIDVPAAAGNDYVVTDLNINQAIKKAINADPVLSKLLVATDGPGNTLVVKALSDGLHVARDLQVEFAQHTAGNANAFAALLGASTGTGSDLASHGPAAGGTDWGAWHTSNALDTGTDIGYKSAFANVDIGGGNRTNIQGANSGHVSDNTIHVQGDSADHDTVVLSTGAHSNDTIVWSGFDNGLVTVVNFDTETETAAPASAKYELVFNNGGTSVSTTGILQVSLPGLGVFDLDFSAAAPTISTIVPALQTAIGTGQWTVSSGTNSVTITQNTAAPLSGIGNPTLGGTVTISHQGTHTNTPPKLDLLGNDKLDFTAYGDVETVLVGDVQADGTVAAWTNKDGGYTLSTLSANAKYITLTRDDTRGTEYTIKLWTVNNTADAYAATSDDTHQVIGKVDLGKVIVGITSDANDVLDHIDIL